MSFGYCKGQPVPWIWDVRKWKPNKNMLFIEKSSAYNFKYFSCGNILFFRNEPIGYISFIDWNILKYPCRLVKRLYIKPMYRNKCLGQLIIKYTANQIIKKRKFWHILDRKNSAHMAHFV